MRFIKNLEDLMKLKEELGVRQDWHEPDEQDLTVDLYNGHFDNAMIDESEAYIVIKQDDKEVVAINVALLLAWATGYER